MQSISTVGLDIAKSVFQVHGVDAAGQRAAQQQDGGKLADGFETHGDTPDARWGNLGPSPGPGKRVTRN